MGLLLSHIDLLFFVVGAFRLSPCRKAIHLVQVISVAFLRASPKTHVVNLIRALQFVLGGGSEFVPLRDSIALLVAEGLFEPLQVLLGFLDDEALLFAVFELVIAVGGFSSLLLLDGELLLEVQREIRLLNSFHLNVLILILLDQVGDN